MGSRELCKLEGYNAMIEGASISVKQWGSGKFRCPWKIADWVEEIHQISFQLDVSFYHILREANDIADHLTGEGTLS